MGELVSGIFGYAGASRQARAAENAARMSADAQLEAARIAAEEARFRPVGVTSRFGTSRFQFGIPGVSEPQRSTYKTDEEYQQALSDYQTRVAKEGRLVGAGYDVAPDIAAIRDRLLSQAGGEQFSQQALQQAQGLFGLGQQFLPTSPETTMSPEAAAYAAQLRGLAGQVTPTTYDPTAAAQEYVQQQQALLRPERERQLAETRESLFRTGRSGLGVAQGGDLQATNPEMAAYYNALAQQDARLAAEGSQIGRQRLAEDIRLGTTLGAGALDTQQRAEALARERILSNLQTGTGLFSTGLNLATGGYDPLKTQVGLSSTLEQLGQSPLDIGAQLGGRVASSGAQAGQSLLAGGMGAARTLQAGTSFSPTGALLSGMANNQQLTSGIGNWLSGLGSSAQQQTVLPYQQPLPSSFNQFLVG